MINHFRTEKASDIKFQLLSVASLQSKINNGLSMQELFNDAERKFDTLIGLLSNEFLDEIILSSECYSLEDLKKLSLLIFERLISNKETDPYMTLCVSRSASVSEIKRRRNRLLHVFHPDRTGNEVSNGSTVVKINEAYEQIVNNLSTSDMSSTSFKKNIPESFSHRYIKQKKSYEKNFYIIIVISISILAFIGLIKIIISN